MSKIWRESKKDFYTHILSLAAKPNRYTSSTVSSASSVVFKNHSKKNEFLESHIIQSSNKSIIYNDSSSNLPNNSVTNNIYSIHKIKPLSIMFHNKNIAVLDTTHGGAIIAIKLATTPTIAPTSVSAVDIYNTTGADTIQNLQDAGVTYHTADAIPNISDFIHACDIIIAPVHMPPAHPLLKEAEKAGIPIITHHQAVGKIVQSAYNIDDATVIEITGTKAKTTTASILAEILAEQHNVVVHTSRGLEHMAGDTVRLLKKGLSITPANVLTALDEINNTLPTLPDVLIFEESLGGCGIADIGIITTTTLDYDIAGGSRKASVAKAQMIQNAKQGSTVLINQDSIDLLHLIDTCTPAPIAAHHNKFKLLTFCDNESAGGNGNENGSNKSNNCDFTINTHEPAAAPEYTESEYIIHAASGKYEPVIFKPRGGYEFNSYRTGIIASASCAMQLGIASSAISKILSNFSGLAGRMQVIEQNGRTVVDNSNSGMDVASVRRAIAMAETLPSQSGTKTVLVFGEDAETVCEGLDIPAASDLLATWDDADVITVGERIHALKNGAKHAKNLDDAMTIANTMTRKDDIILSCVKCFR